jgi:hypothetical protein
MSDCKKLLAITRMGYQLGVSLTDIQRSKVAFMCYAFGWRLPLFTLLSMSHTKVNQYGAVTRYLGACFLRTTKA